MPDKEIRQTEQMQNDNESMLQEVVQNTEMGKNTLEELMGLTHDQALKTEMLRQRNEYRRMNQQAPTGMYTRSSDSCPLLCLCRTSA